MLRAEDMLEEIRQWVAIESPTSAVAAVNSMLSRAQDDFRAAGLITERIPGHDRHCDHFRATMPDAGDVPGILFLSHLDTVHPLGTLDGPLPYRVAGDCAFGPGIYDMKAGAFIALAAYRQLAASGSKPPLPIRWLVTGDEETGSPTSRDLIVEEGRRAKYVLVTEPARDGGKCVTARKGAARFEINFHGRPAHSGSRHHDGRSAVREMARHILDLEALTDYESGLTLSVGKAKGGSAMNVIPEFAEMGLDCRIQTQAQGEEILRRIRELQAYDPDVQISFEGGLDRPPFTKSPAIEQLFEHARGLARDIGFDLQDTATGGGSDGNFLADRLPVLDGIGADGDGAHTMQEHILVSSLVPRAQLMLRLMQTLN